VLSFLSKAREASGSEAARVHYPARRRGGGMAGIDRNYLYRMMKKHGIARKE
jgi:transcriptional regulator of acetoin/glycerol metabolism